LTASKPLAQAWVLLGAVLWSWVTACQDRGSQELRGSASRSDTVAAGTPSSPLQPDPGSTPLHRAALAGDRALVDSLLRAGADPGAHDDPGAQPLHYAARAGDREIAAMLVDRGARVDAATDGGVTPLHEAAARGHAAVVELLVRAGASASLSDFSRNTPLALARSGGHAAVVRLLEPLSPLWVRQPPLDTLTLPPQRGEADDLEAFDATPVARDGAEWWLAVARLRDREGEDPPCKYRRPWSGRPWQGAPNAEAFDALAIERWRFAHDSASLVARTELATEPDQGSPCSEQREIEQRYGRALSGLASSLRPSVVWQLEAVDTFELSGRLPRRLWHREVRDTTVRLALDGDLVRGERRVHCFAADQFAGERCIMVDTPRGEGFASWAGALSAAFDRDTLWVFGLWTRGEQLTPVWIQQPHRTTPLLLGRVPLAAQLGGRR
jgi:hypothetical protein